VGDSLEAGGSTSETVGGAAAGSTAAGGASLAAEGAGLDLAPPPMKPAKELAAEEVMPEEAAKTDFDAPPDGRIGAGCLGAASAGGGPAGCGAGSE